jgi:hypothetical protein
VNVTGWSYVDRLNLGVLACAAHVPEPHRLTTAMAAELQTLRRRAMAK